MSQEQTTPPPHPHECYPALLNALAKGSKELGSEVSENFLKDQILDITQTANKLTIVLKARQLSLDQRLKIESCIVEKLATAQMFVAVQFRKTNPTTMPRPSSPTDNRVEALTVKRDPRAIPLVSKIIAVASGKGGVGKSTVSVGIAEGLATCGLQVGILDADIYGASVPSLYGLRGPLEIDERGKLVPLTAHGIETMSFGYLADAESPAIWRGPMISKAFRQLCYQVAWGELDYLVIDLPPGTGDIQLTMLESLPLHGAIVVTTPHPLALIDLKKAVGMFRKLQVNVIGLIENMAYYKCTHCDNEERLFGTEGGKIYAKQSNIPFIGEIPLQKDFTPFANSGIFMEIARKIADV